MGYRQDSISREILGAKFVIFSKVGGTAISEKWGGNCPAFQKGVALLQCVASANTRPKRHSDHILV